MGGGVRNRSSQIFLIALALSAGGCGASGGSGGISTPPPAPNFLLNLSSTSVSVAQGSTSPPVGISVAPQNGFADSVQVTLSGLPAGVTTNPPSPFSVPVGQTISVLFGAAASASIGQFNLMAQGTSGSLASAESFSLAIQPAAITNLPGSTFVENDSVPAVGTPPGSPPRRQIVFDAANQRFYVANLAMNRVEVYSSVTQTLQTSIVAPRRL